MTLHVMSIGKARQRGGGGYRNIALEGIKTNKM